MQDQSARISIYKCSSNRSCTSCMSGHWWWEYAVWKKRACTIMKCGCGNRRSHAFWSATDDKWLCRSVSEYRSFTVNRVILNVEACSRNEAKMRLLCVVHPEPQTVDLQDTLNHAQISHRNGRPTYDWMADSRHTTAQNSIGPMILLECKSSQPNTCDGVQYLMDRCSCDVNLWWRNGTDGVELSGEYPLNPGKNHV